jgi:hypothetical protein
MRQPKRCTRSVLAIHAQGTCRSLQACAMSDVVVLTEKVQENGERAGRRRRHERDERPEHVDRSDHVHIVLSKHHMHECICKWKLLASWPPSREFLTKRQRRMSIC